MIYALKKDTLDFNKGDRFSTASRNGVEVLTLINGTGELRRSAIKDDKFAAFFELVEEDTPSNLYEPKVGEEYYFLGSTGTISQTTHGQTMADQNRIDMGNAYKDEASANRAAAYQKARALIVKDGRAIKPAADATSAHAIGVNTETGNLVAFEYNLEEGEYVPPIAFYETDAAVEAVLADPQLVAAYQTYFAGE